MELLTYSEGVFSGTSLAITTNALSIVLFVVASVIVIVDVNVNVLE